MKDRREYQFEYIVYMDVSIQACNKIDVQHPPYNYTKTAFKGISQSKILLIVCFCSFAQAYTYDSGRTVCNGSTSLKPKNCQFKQNHEEMLLAMFRK